MRKNVTLVTTLATTIALVGATGIATGFAWLTTNASASLTYNKMTLTHTGSETTVTDVAGFYNATVTASSDAAATVTGSSAVSDVSSTDGIHFYKPVWAAGENEGLYTEAVSNEDGTTTAASGPQYTEIKDVTGVDNAYTSTIIEMQFTPNNYAFNIEITELDIKLADEDSTATNDTNLLRWSRVAVTVFTGAQVTDPDTGAVLGYGSATRPTLVPDDTDTRTNEAALTLPANNNEFTVIAIDEDANRKDGARDYGTAISKTVAGSTDSEGNPQVVGTLPALGATDDVVVSIADDRIIDSSVGGENGNYTLVSGLQPELGTVTYYVLVTMWMEGTNGNQNSAGGGEIALDLTIGAVDVE